MSAALLNASVTNSIVYICALMTTKNLLALNKPGRALYDAFTSQVLDYFRDILRLLQGQYPR